MARKQTPMAHPVLEFLEEEPSILDFPDSELVFALVNAVGTDCRGVIKTISDLLAKYGYSTTTLRLSSVLNYFDFKLAETPEYRRIETRMNAGNKVCRRMDRKDFFALAAAAEIGYQRGRTAQPKPRTAYVLSSLKRPEEVYTLRKIYGAGFFVIGIFATEEERRAYLLRKNTALKKANELIARDQDENDDFGQHTRDTFYLADVFVRLRDESYKEELERFFKLVFCHPYITPTPDEYAMFLAYSASLRSAQLGRQVGAAITSEAGDVLSVGCNDVPKAGGGLYWPGPNDCRDHILKDDSNDRRLKEMYDQIAQKFSRFLKARATLPPAKRLLRGILDITEFGRAVHAEMDALLTAARCGVTPTRGTLFTTTFPCHNCTRHIIAAGVRRVVYIEPYAKSKAEELHSDAIKVEERAEDPKISTADNDKLPFHSFVGIGPRRFYDLFSLSLSSGYRLSRKRDGKTVGWSERIAIPRVPMQPNSYLQREKIAYREVLKRLKV